MIYVLTSSNSPVLMPFGRLLCHSLIDNGYEVEEQNSATLREVKYEKDDIVIVIGAHRFPDIIQEKKDGVTYVLWNSEPIPTTPGQIEGTNIYNQRFDLFKKLLPYYDYYFDYWEKHYNVMRALGFKCDGWCGLGYHRSLDYTEKYPEDLKYDAMFLGSLGGRRQEICKQIASKIKMYPQNRLWGEAKYLAYSQCKVGLNIHYEALDGFEEWRIIDMLCNKRLVISEAIIAPIPLKNGEHFLEVPREDFFEKVEEVIKNYSKYHHIAKQGYEFLRNSCKFNDNTKKMMEIIFPNG